MSSDPENDFVYLLIREREAGLAYGKSVLINVVLNQPSLINWKFEAHCFAEGTDSVLISTAFQLYANVHPRDARSGPDGDRAGGALTGLDRRLRDDGWEPVGRFPWESGTPDGPWYGRRYRMAQDRFRAIEHTYPRSTEPGSEHSVLPWVAAVAVLAVLTVAAVILTHGGSAPQTTAGGAAPAVPAATSSPAPAASAPSVPPGQPGSSSQAGATGSGPAWSRSPGTRRTPAPPGGGGPSTGAVTLAAPAAVAATALGQYQIRVSWSEASAGVAGFHINNGCSSTTCQPGAALVTTTGPVSTVTFTVTPGTYQCFRAQAFNHDGTSAWSGYGCTTTPSLTVPGTRKWTATSVHVGRGDVLGVTAGGLVNIDPAYPQGPAGNPSCTPAVNYAAASSTFPAPDLPCWSLVARIGNGPAFEIGTSALTTATASGRLYLGVNDGDFSDNSGSWTVNIKIGGLPPAA